VVVEDERILCWTQSVRPCVPTRERGNEL
jgi:hypothetical protein